MAYPWQKRQSLWAQLKENVGPLTTLRFGLVLFIIQYAFLVNGNYFAEAGFSQNVALIYIILPIGLLAYSYREEKVIENLNLWRVAVMAVIGFTISAPVIFGLFHFVLGTQLGTTPANAVIGVILIQILFVAPVEELAFRAYIPTWLENHFPTDLKYMALGLSQVLFALMHWGVYGGNIGSLVIAFMVGSIWLTLYRFKPKNFLGGGRLGIGFTIGSHACYNLIISGVLIGNIGMVVGG